MQLFSYLIILLVIFQVQAKTLNVLFIGNSYTFRPVEAGGVPTLVQGLAKSSGNTHRISSYSFRPWIVSSLKYFPHIYVLWHLALCIVTFGFPNSKKNSFRGNYMRKYGIYKNLHIEPFNYTVKSVCFDFRSTNVGRSVIKTGSSEGSTLLLPVSMSLPFNHLP